MQRIALSIAIGLAAMAGFTSPWGTGAASAAEPAATAPAGLFGQVVVFGDSFSDTGNFSTALGFPEVSRFTTNPGLVAVEHIANHFDAPIRPSLLGGTNYAYAMAGVLLEQPDDLSFVTSIPAQLDAHLQASAGKADPRALYVLEAGANDVFTAFEQVGDGTILPQEAESNLQAAAQAEFGMISRLQQAGARHLMVFALPDLGLSPDVIAFGPEIAAELSDMTRLYNQAVDAGLAHAGLDIIPVNTFVLFNEFVADPARYGFTDVTTAACSDGGESLQCGPQGSGAPYTYAPGAENSHLFADFAHPSSAAHAMLAQYAESIVIAPGQISLLGEAPLQVNASVNRAVLDQARTSLGHAPGNGLRVWANYDYARQRLDAQVDSPKSSNDVHTLSVGGDVHPSNALTAGLAFSVGRQRDDFAGHAGGFRLQDLLATGYAMWSWQRAYFGAIGSFGHLGYNDIQRKIPIGPTVRNESGDTSGSHAGFALTGGWWLDFGNWKAGPYADVTWQRIAVNGFGENGTDAAAMTFGRQHRHSLIGTLGWQMTANLQAGGTQLHPFARVAWNHDDAGPTDVTAGLVSMSGTFTLPGFAPDKNWGSVSAGLTADFSPDFSGWISYDGRFSDSSQRVDSLNIGARLRF